jgi:hypothetical protein
LPKSALVGRENPRPYGDYKMGSEEDMSAATNSKIEAREPSRPGLESQYRKVGISALAATLRYTGEQKNDAYAPKPRVVTLRDLEMLAI